MHLVEDYEAVKSDYQEAREKIRNLLDDLKTAGDQNAQIIDAFQKQFSDINVIFESIMENIEDLHCKSKNIKGIVDVISNIARQTNLLAINATIEAARAGSNGKAFGVVAEEVKRLSTQTSASSVKIQEIVGEISTEIGAAKKNVDEIADSFGNLSFQNISIGEGADASNTAVQKLAGDMIESIRSRVNPGQISSGTKQVMDEFQRAVERIVESFSRDSRNVISMYFWADPALFGFLKPEDHTYGITSVIGQGSVGLDRDLVLKDFKPGNKFMAWYYNTTRARKSMWHSLAYDVHLQKEVLSYTIPLYVNDTLIGVGGADLDFEEYRRMKQDFIFSEISQTINNLTGH